MQSEGVGNCTLQEQYMLLAIEQIHSSPVYFNISEKNLKSILNNSFTN